MIDKDWGQFKRLIASWWLPVVLPLLIFIIIDITPNASAQQNNEEVVIQNVEPTVSAQSEPNPADDVPTNQSSPAIQESTSLEEHFFAYYLQSTGLHNSSEAKLLAKELVSLSKQHNTYPELTLARLMVESNACHYVPGTKEVKRGSHGEYGISQIHPSWINKKINGVKITREKLENPIDNIKIGLLIYKRYETDPKDYLMAITQYNRPGSRKPNKYALRVNKKYQEIKNYYRLWAESRFIQKTDLESLLTLDNGV